MNINYNSKERYNVYFGGSFSTYNTTIERILSLKTTDFQNQKPGTFHIEEDIDWDHAILRAFLDVLYYFKERGIQWDFFYLRFYARHQSFTSVLLQTVNELNIFKKLHLELRFVIEDDVYSADCEYLFPGINHNKQLEFLQVEIDGYYLDRFEEDFTALGSHLREMTGLKELRLRKMVHFNTQSFSQGLSENKSLENLKLNFYDCNGIADEGLSDIITSLASHPKLEDLSIATKDDQFGELSSKALQKLLSKTQTLSMLHLYTNNNGYSGGLNAECIVQGLKKNQSLKSLKIVDSLYGDLMLSKFFQILPHCPKLERLELWEDSITKTDLEQVIHMDKLQKPIKLQIRENSIRDNAAIMTKLLRCHPEVRLILGYCRNFKNNNVELKHIYDWNWNGRYLIDRSTTSVPLSLWPIVFENVKNKPSIIY